MRVIGIVKKPIGILLLASMFMYYTCACVANDKMPVTTVSISVSEETSIQTNTENEFQSVPAITEKTDDRYIEFDGEKLRYEDILNEAGYTEVFAPEKSMDLSRFTEVLATFGYRDTQYDTKDVPEVVACMESEDGLDKITLSEYASEEDAHNAVYKYVVTTIHAYNLPEMTYGLILEISLHHSYLWVAHMDFQDYGNRMILFYQTGTSVISAQIGINGMRIDTFTLAMKELGFKRSGVEYDLQENVFPDKAGECTAEEFSAILAEYGYPIEQQVVEDQGIWGGNEDNTVYWTYEQYESIAYCETIYAMNFANAWMTATDQGLDYFSGANYEMWIDDSATLGYQINIREGNTFVSICGSPNDDGMKAHIQSMIADAFF